MNIYGYIQIYNQKWIISILMLILVYYRMIVLIIFEYYLYL